MNSESDDDFRNRMNVLVTLTGSWVDLARKSGLSRRVLDKYRSGESDPSRSRLIALADAAEVSVEWLATGRGPMRPNETAPAKGTASGVDRDLLAAVHKGIAEVYRSENARISADPLAGEVARIYDDLVAIYESSEERLTGLKVMLHHLRRDLRTATAANEDRSKKASSE